MPATNTATPTETKQTAEQIPQPKEPTKGFDPDSIRFPEEAHAEEVIYSTTPPGSFCCLAFF